MVLMLSDLPWLTRLVAMRSESNNRPAIGISYARHGRRRRRRWYCGREGWRVLGGAIGGCFRFDQSAAHRVHHTHTLFLNLKTKQHTLTHTGHTCTHTHSMYTHWRQYTHSLPSMNRNQGILFFWVVVVSVLFL